MAPVNISRVGNVAGGGTEGPTHVAVFRMGREAEFMEPSGDTASVASQGRCATSVAIRRESGGEMGTDCSP